jgi:RHS repeat-associated protein
MRHNYTYAAFGTTERQGSTQNSYRFTGEQFDESLGEYYLRDRFYAPSSGRFLRRDKYGGHVTSPMTLHKYTYVHNNAVNHLDPSGFLRLQEQVETMSTISILNQIASNLYAFSSTYRLVEAAAIAVGIISLSGASGTLPFDLEIGKKNNGDPDLKLFPSVSKERDLLKKQLEEENNNVHQMRVQLQSTADHGIALIASPEVGVTHRQVRDGLWNLWMTRSMLKGWNSRYDEQMQTSIVLISKYIKGVRGTSAGREQVATSQWTTNGKLLPFNRRGGDYRVDLENLRGANLRDIDPTS